MKDKNEPFPSAPASKSAVAGALASPDGTTDREAPTGQRGSGLEPRLTSREFWFELLVQLDFYDAKILEHVYILQKGTTTLQLLVRHLRHVGIKREALRRRVLTMARLGLFEVAHRTRPLCICARLELEDHVISLVRGVFDRLGVGTR